MESHKKEENKENQNEIQFNLSEKEKNSIDRLIYSISKSKSTKAQLLEKLRPFYTLKINPKGEMDKFYSSVEKIEPELIEVNEYEGEKFVEKTIFTTHSKIEGLRNLDLGLPSNLFRHKPPYDSDNKDNKLDTSKENNTKKYCIYSIIIRLFRIKLDFNDIKLSKEVMKELETVKNSNENEAKILLKKLSFKFGLYVPLELIVGGRISYSFEANSDEEIREKYSLLKQEININNNLSNSSVENIVKTNDNTNPSKFLGKIENLSIKIEGGDYTIKNDLQKWIQSFNIDNLHIIEYKSLQPIYRFIPGLESKLESLYKDI